MGTGSCALERCEFGPGGVDYIRYYLACNGGAFGNLLGPLLARRELEAGSTWAFLPSGRSAQAEADFKAGGLVPTGPSRRVPQGVLVYVRTESVDQAVIEWVAATLESGDPDTAVLCVENTFWRRDQLSQPPSEHALPTFLCGDYVYDYACSRRCLAPVVRAARGACSMPNVGIITKRPDSLETLAPRPEVSSAALEEMAEAARAIIVGAWDAEGVPDLGAVERVLSSGCARTIVFSGPSRDHGAPCDARARPAPS